MLIFVLMGLVQIIKNPRKHLTYRGFLGCPDGLGLFYQNFKKFQIVSNY